MTALAEGKEKRRKLLENVVYSFLLYWAPVQALAVHWVPGDLDEVRKIQGWAALQCVVMYHTISYDDADLLIELFVGERAEIC